MNTDRTHLFSRLAPVFAAGLTLLTGGVRLRAQSCAVNNVKADYVEYASEALPYELSGFFPYILPNSGPLPKYRTESWTGAGASIEPSCGCFIAKDNMIFSGGWTFSKTDFSDSSDKARAYDKSGCVVQAGVVESNLKVGITDSGMPGAGDIQSTTRSATYGDLPQYSCGPWMFYHDTSVTETLGTPFSVQDGITRGEAYKTTGAASLQFWNNFFPATASDVTANNLPRTAPVTFHAQRVKFRAKFKVCPGKWQITYYYYRWPVGGTQPAEPNYTESDTVTFKDGSFFVPEQAAGGSPVYHQYPELAQGQNCLLAYAVATQGCNAGNAGDNSNADNSVDAAFSLGHRLNQQAAGQLSISAQHVAAALYAPSALVAAVPTAPDVVIVRDSNQAVRQASAPECLADVVTIDSTTFEIRYYYASQVGAQNPTTSLFAFSGSPYVVYRIENPDAGTATNRFKLTETRGAQTKTTMFTDSSGTMEMSLSGLRTESLAITTNGSGDTVKTRTIKDGASQTVAVTQETWRTYGWGQNLLQSVADPAGAALTTNYAYYTDVANDGPNFGQLKQKVEPSGRWEVYTYDAQSRLVKTVSQYLDSSVASADNLNRVTTVTYGTIADQDSDSTPEILVTTVQALLGQEIGRSHEVIYSHLSTVNGQSVETRAEIQCTVAGAAWDAATNLVTKQQAIKGGGWDGRPISRLNPDNTLSTYSYTVGTSLLTTTSYAGANDGTGTAITNGTKTVTVESLTGQLVSRDTYDYPSLLHLSSENVTQQDSLGRPTRIDYLDGTFELRSYACCGMDSQTDRTGITATFDYNALGYVYRETRAGIASLRTLDPFGRVLTATRVGTDNSQITVETNHYDLAGRRDWTKDALNRQTSFSETIDGSGHTVRATTNPDGGTRTETFAKDGSILSVTGTAASQKLAYEYGVDTSGVFSKEIHTGASGENTEWVKSYVDFAGRPGATVYPDGATEQLFYNALGKLAKRVDADGVSTLFAYNARGEQEYTAVDLDRNDTIDFSGGDLITRFVNDVVTDHGVTVLRTTTRFWTTTGTADTQVVSVKETTPDGRESWQTDHDLTTHTTIVYGSGGIRTETSTAPDGTVTTRVFTYDRKTSVTVTHPNIGQLSAMSYAYDPHGRLQAATDARNGTSSYTYFADDQLQTVATPDPDATRSGTGYDSQTTTFGYDSAGRRSSVTQPDNGTVTTVYFPTGQVQRITGVRTYPVEYSYDTQGRLKTLKTWQNYASNSGAAVTTWNYDAQRGLLASKAYADNQGPTYTYFASGRLHTRTWARGVTATYAYNNAGLLSGTTYSDATPSVSVSYDRQGRIATVTDAAGLLTRTYHSSGEPDDESYSSGALNGLGITRDFDSLNRPSAVGVPVASHAVAYGYDSASRLLTVTAGTNSASYGYAANANLIETVTLKNGAVTRLTSTRSFDHLNRLTSIANNLTAATVSRAYDYNSANQRVKATLADGSYWSYSYDTFGQVTTSTRAQSSGTAILGHTFGWTFDEIGNRLSATTNGRTATYTPDSLNQYTQRTVPGAVDVIGSANQSATVLVNQQLAQRQNDLFYRAVSVSNTSSPVWQPIELAGVRGDAGPAGEDAVTVQNAHAFVPSATELFTRDADGNLTGDGHWNYSWDGENRLITMETVGAAVTAGAPRQKIEFSYDAQSRRIERKTSTWSGSAYTLATRSLFLYDDWNVQAEVNALSSNAAVRTYVWGCDLSGSPRGAGGAAGLLIFGDATSATAHFAAYDGNGNVITLANTATGAVSAEYDYNAFGEIVRMNGTMAAANPIRFSTKYCEQELGLLDYGFRYYQPSTGRFLGRDPITEDGGVNLFGFVQNDPISHVDSLGLAESSLDTADPALLEEFGLVRGPVRPPVRVPVPIPIPIPNRPPQPQPPPQKRPDPTPIPVPIPPPPPPTQAKCNECKFNWLGYDTGGNPQHAAYIAKLSKELMGPFGNVDVTTPEGVTQRFDGGGPAPIPAIVFEAKTGHEWAANPDAPQTWFDTRAAQFGAELAVAIRCKLQYRIYFQEARAYRGFRTRLPVYSPFALFHP